jgi:hypothetical protein
LRYVVIKLHYSRLTYLKNMKNAIHLAFSANAHT